MALVPAVLATFFSGKRGLEEASVLSPGLFPQPHPDTLLWPGEEEGPGLIWSKQSRESVTSRKRPSCCGWTWASESRGLREAGSGRLGGWRGAGELWKK